MDDGQGGIDEWVGTASDITERKMAEEKLKESDRRKDDFLAMLAHELRNPLAPIGTAAALLQSAALDEQRVRRTSRIIGRQVAHMTELIDDLLDVSRVTRGLITLNTAPLDIGHIVHEAVEQVMPLMNARGHALSLSQAPGEVLVMGDRKRLVQVVSNILNNAAKYTREGGAIRVRSQVRDGQIHVEIADNGVGMTPQVVAHAFELFAQAERTPDRSTGGLGLGLALVKSLVELHGGSVSCSSQGLGHGSTFEIRLPCLVPAAAEQAAPEREPEVDEVKPLRILIVDDNVDAADMMAMLLESAGHEVAVEHGPGEALVRARAQRSQVCLVDIGLPGMDGYAVVRRLREQAETAGAMLVAVPGYGQEEDRRRSREAGFDHHLVKPVDQQALYEILASVGSAPAR
jgi:CheY-like chemotaxis protein/two-component sensor histidine kinase